MLSRLNGMFSRTGRYLRTHPLPRGMLTYSITWPVGSLIQQTFDSKEYNLPRALKFGLFGSMYVAPTLYGWMKLSCVIWPKPILIHSVSKAVIEQVTYSPFAISSFLFIVTFLDGESVNGCVEEVKKKLVPIWKISACFWPVIQTVNYSIIPERNRIPFIGVCSLCWTVFLAFVKYHQKKD